MAEHITKDELAARLDAVEARVDAKLTAISGKLDAFLAGQLERDRTAEQRDLRLEERVKGSITLSDEWNQKFRMIAERSVEASVSAEESAKEASSLKTHFWLSVGAQLLAVAAILVGAYLANQASVLGITANTLSAYQAGKADEKSAAEREKTEQK